MYTAPDGHTYTLRIAQTQAGNYRVMKRNEQGKEQAASGAFKDRERAEQARAAILKVYQRKAV